METDDCTMLTGGTVGAQNYRRNVCAVFFYRQYCTLLPCATVLLRQQPDLTPRERAGVRHSSLALQQKRLLRRSTG